MIFSKWCFKEVGDFSSRVVVAKVNLFERLSELPCMLIYSIHPNQNLIRNREPRPQWRNRQENLVFVVHHTNRKPIPSDFACRRRDATLTPQKVFNCRILYEYRVISLCNDPTVTRRNGKKTWIVATHSPGNALDIIKTRKRPENSETFFKLKTQFLLSSIFWHREIWWRNVKIARSRKTVAFWIF